MNMTRADCKLLRAIINLTMLGPAWFNDTPTDPMLRALHYELRKQTAEWIMANVVRELNDLLPSDERVSLAGMHATLLQAAAHSPAQVVAVLSAQAQVSHSAESPASSPAADLPADPASSPDTVPEPGHVSPPMPAPSNSCREDCKTPEECFAPWCWCHKS